MTAHQFQPLHEKHAIVEQTIFFEFSPTLQSVMPALISLKDDLHNAFPSHEVLQSISLMVAGPGVDPAKLQPQIHELAGLRLNRFKADGSIAMRISVEANAIGISCFEYGSWEKIWPEQQEFIRSIFAKFSGSNTFLTGIGMKWLDQFLYTGDDETYSADRLLRTGSPYLHPKAFDSGTRWHCHSGWFDGQTFDGKDILNQVNVDAGIVNIHGSMRTAVTIDHIQVLRASTRPDELAAFAPGASSLDALSGLMDALHDGNKRILGDLLTDSFCDRIGLKREQVG